MKSSGHVSYIFSILWSPIFFSRIFPRTKFREGKITQHIFQSFSNRFSNVWVLRFLNSVQIYQFFVYKLFVVSTTYYNLLCIYSYATIKSSEWIYYNVSLIYIYHFASQVWSARSMRCARKQKVFLCVNKPFFYHLGQCQFVCLLRLDWSIWVV